MSAGAIKLPDSHRFCGQCGYSLCGLPPAGRCPECGGEYDEHTLVLYGWAGPTRATAASAPPGRYLLILLATSGLALIQGLQFLLPARGDRDWILALGLGLAIIGGLAGVQLRRRQSLLDRAPGPAQARFTPRGFAQREGPGPVNLRPWASRHQVSVHRTKRGLIRITVAEAPYGLTGAMGVDIEFASELSPQDWQEVVEALRCP